MFVKLLFTINYFHRLGLTPARKEFQYPRNLTATSPHERILQRFREIRKNINTSESDVSYYF